jgi:hypothetical protein
MVAIAVSVLVTLYVAHVEARGLVKGVVAVKRSFINRLTRGISYFFICHAE